MPNFAVLNDQIITTDGETAHIRLQTAYLFFINEI